jgi:benzoate-CoA ligase family protein
VSDELLPKIETVRSHLEHLRHIIVVGKAKEGHLNYQHLTEKASPELETLDTSKDDVGFWLYSSGTTGKPKGVVHLQHDMIYSAESYGTHILEMGGNDRVYSVSRLFFAAGLGAAFNFPFHAGACTVLYPGRPLPETNFEIINKYHPSILFGVPTAYNAMLQIEDAEKKYDLSSLHICASAGEALPVAIFDRWKQKFGMEILDGIGSTEALHVFCSNKRGDVRAGSSGKPFPGYELKIVDETGLDVPQGEVGTLYVQGESNFAFYWNKHDKTRETIIGAWINTGDKYYQDSDGYFWNVGRTDDMLKVGGIWVSPLEVENCILQHPSVVEVAVVGAEDEERLVKPKAFIVLKPGFAPSADLASEIQSFTKTRIAPYKYPRWIQFVSELPKTATGKIQRFKIRHGDTG